MLELKDGHDFNGKRTGVDYAGETNATLNISDANATLHDGNLFGGGDLS